MVTFIDLLGRRLRQLGCGIQSHLAVLSKQRISYCGSAILYSLS